MTEETDLHLKPVKIISSRVLFTLNDGILASHVVFDEMGKHHCAVTFWGDNEDCCISIEVLVKIRGHYGCVRQLMWG